MECGRFSDMIDDIPKDIVKTENNALNNMRMVYAASMSIDKVAEDMNIDVKYSTNDIADEMFAIIQKEEAYGIPNVDAVIFKDCVFDNLKEKFIEILENIEGKAEDFEKLRCQVKDTIKNLCERVKETVGKITEKVAEKIKESGIEK